MAIQTNRDPLLFPSCLVCRHFDPRGLPRCTAYPDGIPLPIIGGDLAHDRPLPGDHGIQFEPLTREELRVREGRLSLDLPDSLTAGAEPVKAAT